MAEETRCFTGGAMRHKESREKPTHIRVENHDAATLAAAPQPKASMGVAACDWGTAPNMREHDEIPFLVMRKKNAFEKYIHTL